MSVIYRRTDMCGELNISDVNREVVLNGWVAKRRNLGGLIFVDLRDKTGIVQVTFDDTVPEEIFAESKDTVTLENCEERLDEIREKMPDQGTLFDRIDWSAKNAFPK